MLESLGYEEVAERDQADLILFNTCSIRESADSRFLAHLGQAKRLKSEDPSRVVGVGGCWAQSVKDEVFERFPFVDVAFGPGQIHRLAEFLTTDSIGAQGYFEFEGFAGHLPMKRSRRFQAWLQISQGCNCVCSYCIVPSTRGRESSRPAGELLTEVQRLAADGVREVTLLGQNVNSYGRDLPGDERTTFAELLRAVDGVDGINRIRYPRPHPKDMREDVILAHAECASLCEHIHLPLQSGSDPILKAMRRTYNRRRYLDRVALIREHVPDVALTTDIIVGFPGRPRRTSSERLRSWTRSPTTAPSRSSSRRAAGPRRRRSRTGAAPGQARAHGAARGARATAGARACAALRRAHDGGAGGGGEPHGRDARARPHVTQQGGELRRDRGAGGDGRGRDHGGDLDDSGRARAAREPRRPSAGSRRCGWSRSSAPRPPARPVWRSPWPRSSGHAAKIRSRSTATRSRSIAGSRR